MNAILIAIIARFVNADTVGGIVRGIVGPLFGFLAAWFAVKLPFLADYFSPFNAGLVGTAITALLMSIWSGASKQMTAPTETQVVKVIQGAAATGVVSAATAAQVTAEPAIAMPDKAVGNI